VLSAVHRHITVQLKQQVQLSLVLEICVSTVCCDVTEMFRTVSSLHTMTQSFKCNTFVGYLRTVLGVLWGTRWRSWLRHCATKRKVAGSIPDDVIGIFNLHNPSGRTMGVGLIQPLAEMSTRNISWG